MTALQALEFSEYLFLRYLCWEFVEMGCIGCKFDSDLPFFELTI